MFDICHCIKKRKKINKKAGFGPYLEAKIQVHRDKGPTKQTEGEREREMEKVKNNGTKMDIQFVESRLADQEPIV